MKSATRGRLLDMKKRNDAAERGRQNAGRRRGMISVLASRQGVHPILKAEGSWQANVDALPQHCLVLFTIIAASIEFHFAWWVRWTNQHEAPSQGVTEPLMSGTLFGREGHDWFANDLNI